MNKKKYMGLAVISAMMMLSVTAWAANEGPLTISRIHYPMMVIQVVQRHLVM